MDILPKIITKGKVIGQFKDEKQYSNWISNKLKTRTYIKIRNNLYGLVDPSTNDIYGTKFEIASNISETSFICFHSALEYYGIANQVFNDVIVGSLTKFNGFTFNDNEFIYKPAKSLTLINDVASEGIRVTSLEKTIVDCIDEISFSGGIEEVLNALEQIKYLNEEKLIEALDEYGKMFLYQKVGYLLETYNDRFNLAKDFFGKCKSHLTNKANYLEKDAFKKVSLNKDWNLLVPLNIQSRINGGFW